MKTYLAWKNRKFKRSISINNLEDIKTYCKTDSLYGIDGVEYILLKNILYR